MKKNFIIDQIKERLAGISCFSLIIALLFSFQLISAADGVNGGQQGKHTVTGIITDASTKEPLPGVSILIKGTTTGGITDLNGKFSIQASDNDVLVISYVGYLSQNITVGSQTNINVALSPDIIGLNQVVVMGYGVQQKKLVTGATVQVKSNDILKDNSTRLESSLQGLTPGMVIVKQSGQPGSDYNITIRGLGSVNGSNPLVLIDGVPGKISDVNPNDVATVDVLKDAASAAIYGSRASDGVILITTKQGKEGKAQINYDFHYGISNPVRLAPMLTAHDYAMLQNEMATNTYRSLPFTQGYVDSLGAGTNWQKEALNRNAPSQSHYLGISGGNEKSTYLLSFSYDNQEGIYDYENKSNYERIGFLINSQHKLKKYLTVGENLHFYHRNTRGLGVTNIYNDFMRNILQADPTQKAYDPTQPDGFGRSTYDNIDLVNPLAYMHYDYNGKNHNDNLTGDVYATIKLIKGLSFKSDFGATLYLQNNTTANDTFTYNTQNFYRHIPEYDQYMSRDFSYNWDNYLTYEKNFGKNNLKILLGTNAENYWKFNIDARMNGFLVNSHLPPVLSNVVSLQPGVQGDTIKLYGDYGLTDSRFSIYSRINYNYNQKYLLMVSLRRDGSSRFGPSHRYGYFPAVSAGWVITNESFMEPLSTWLNFFKLRGSWGENGKEPDQPFRFLATVASAQNNTESRGYTFGNAHYTGMSPDILANPDLKWESTIETDIGFDSRFFKNFNFNFDWYKKTSGDWIVPVTVAEITGIQGISNTRPYKNGGNVTNTGEEFQLGYVKKVGDFYFNIQANFSHNKNLVTSVPDSVIHGSTSVLYNGSQEFYRVQAGYPIGYFWGYKTDGLFQTQAEVDNYVNADGTKLQPRAQPGDVKRVDVNGDGVINEKDKVMLGDPHPHYTYGINLSASYKGLDLSINIAGQGGNKIVQCYTDQSRYNFNSTTAELNRWHWVDKNNNGIVDPGEGIGNTIPRVTGGADANSNWRDFSNLYIHNGAFMRVKSVNLGYDFKKLLKQLPVEKLRLYVSATNLLTFTKYNGMDPEVGYGSYYGSNGYLVDAYASGIDLGFYPSARTYLVGVNVTF